MPLTQRIRLILITVLLISLTAIRLTAQNDTIKGIVTDTSGVALAGVTIYIPSSSSGTVSDENGLFSVPLPAGENQYTIVFSSVGYKADTLLLTREKSINPLNVTLENEIIEIGTVEINASGNDNITAIPVPVVAGMVIPSVSGGIEAAITTLPGVSSFSELSSSYSVRGGSYDENLVYINDVEVYRPYLIRSGQQEGLSRINPDLTARVSFSPGGFSAAYGDRMSSVLDISYREPEAFEASASLSLITSSVHAGARSRNNKFYIIAGARYRTNALLLNSLDLGGRYSPHFADIQAMAGYNPGGNTRITLLLWGSSNRYTFMPESQTTTFGTTQDAFKLYAWFDGGERDIYDCGGGDVTISLLHNNGVSSKIILSGYRAAESENFDIRGAYNLTALDKTEGSENNPDSIINAGVGSWLSHARNSLYTGMISLSYKGFAAAGPTRFEWGLTARHRSHDIDVNEWTRVDSAGFTVGRSDDELTLTSFNDHSREVNSTIAEAYLINRSSFSLGGMMCELNAGIRAAYDTYNSEILISPRISVSVPLSPRLSAQVSAGAYHQPPGGREMMLQTENESLVLKAQRSMHIIAGLHYDFIAWERPFRFTGEAYGRFFNRLIPYTVDNVRLIYYGGNIAEGYSAGLDLRVNGEFVRGVESWFSLSFMKSEMKIPLYNTGWFPSPFDQRLNFSIFFQDYLPGHPDFRANINIAFGTGIPTSPPGRNQWDVWFRMPPYRRVDIGFSKVLIGNNRKGQRSFIKELMAGVEVFNLADTRNTISYTWIRTVKNSEGRSLEYAVPNYLTSRSLNLKLSARF
ncbi:MAG: carboxypeptidase-like regulatory domain-containing protein [Bacteroidales bacterium]